MIYDLVKIIFEYYNNVDDIKQDINKKLISPTMYPINVMEHPELNRHYQNHYKKCFLKRLKRLVNNNKIKCDQLTFRNICTFCDKAGLLIKIYPTDKLFGIQFVLKLRKIATLENLCDALIPTVKYKN